MLERARKTHWTAVLALAGAALTSHMSSADTLRNETSAMHVAFAEPESVVQEDLALSTTDDVARPSIAPALPVDATNPSQPCGNIMLAPDSLCQYAGATQASPTAMVNRR